MSSSFDTDMMRIALRLARRGLGQTAPNPSVGTVIADVNTGEVIARGWTQAGGRPHAETEAIRRAGERARGATLYVTLEPCAHHGKTPPCADAIIAAGLSRVIIGTADPDPRTAGKGCKKLREANIAVEEGVLEPEAHYVTLGHISRVTRMRPFVQVKLAVDGKGNIAHGKCGRPVWVTGAEARAHGHLMRAEADAIIVGAGTVRDDDPELTCRLPGLLNRSPQRVILDSRLSLPLNAKVFRQTGSSAKVTVAALANEPAEKASRFEANGVRVLTFPAAASGLGIDITALLTRLAEEGTTRVLVEGGPQTWRAFGDAGAVDEVVIFQSGAGLAAGDCLARWLPGVALPLAKTRRIGDDHCHVFRSQ
jgi:diaminohydroxyphosphoribosylaminopyrimidine deaminase/5-amino-6-(5-phosphoribosylamino)uracil reductase